MSEKVIENQFQITGMTCAACANRIEKGLEKNGRCERSKRESCFRKSDGPV